MAKPQTIASRKWQEKNIDSILLKMNKKDNFIPLLEKAVSVGLAKSRQAYILDAIREKLSRDGITLDMHSDE